MDKNDDLLIEQFLGALKNDRLPSDAFLARVSNAIGEAEAPVAATLTAETAGAAASGRLVWLSRLWTFFCIAVGVVVFIVTKGWLPLLTFVREVPLSTIVESYALPLGFSLGVALLLLVIEHERAEMAQ